jgi:hypothetical protein
MSCKKELAIQQHVVAGEKFHDLRVGFDTGFLPKKIAHARILS